MVDKTSTTKKKSLTQGELNQILVDNFTNLQRVLTNLSIKFDELSTNMLKLLQLFEISAKSFAEKYSGKKIEEPVEKQTSADTEYLSKLDSLLDQNKTIAKGIMLMEERIRQRNTSPQPKEDSGFEGMIKSRPLPKY